MFVEVVAAKIGIGAVVVKKVIDDDQDGMGHRDRRLLVASTSGKTPELGAEVGVLGAHRGMRGFDQSHADPRVPAPDAAALTFTRMLVVARADACPCSTIAENAL